MSAPEKDIADIMYPDAMNHAMESSLREQVPRLRDSLNITQAEADALGRQHIELFKGAVLERDAPRLHDLLVRHTINPPDEDQVSAWTVEANRRLHAIFGEETDRVKDELRAYVAKRPELEKALNETGLGSNPDFVIGLAQKAWVRRGNRPK